MDIKVLFQPIMTDPSGSKSNIAARFQNAINLNYPTPIGVFWDIENCQVPKGKSAIALVQNIREKFFVEHREAEFMCVCDINKESKVVIQELLYAQVTVVHISATSKNAADDKLKQCMKRFVDTHGSPSTLLLMSDDVNFASDLSDFRHRHNIRIILVHRDHAHQSLLACAHEHYNFHTLTQDLPSRSPLKSSDNRPCELEVSELPVKRKETQIKNRLHKLSNNCGGKVVSINGAKAVIRFANADSAEKAKKRMDKEIVFGNKICVNFRNRIDAECSSPKEITKGFNSSDDSSVTQSSSSSRDSSLSPPPYRNITNNLCSTLKNKFDFPPPPVIDNQNFPSFLSKGDPKCPDRKQNFTESSKLPCSVNIDTLKNNKTAMDWNNITSGYHTHKYQELSAFSPFKKDQEYNLKKCSHSRNVGLVPHFVKPDCDIKTIKNFTGQLSDPSSNRRNYNDPSSTFPNVSSHNYHGLSQSFISMKDIQRISDPISYASQWSIPTNLPLDSNHSISRSISDGPSVELHVSNLDSTFEVNEMKKILLSVFSEHVFVLHISMSLQPDGSAKATVKVPSLQDAQYAISRLHRKKIGHKRILISYLSSERIPPFHVLKSETIALLNDIPAKHLPLINFRDLYEKRQVEASFFSSLFKKIQQAYRINHKYHRPIAVSELYKMRDVVSIQGDSGSRMVYLNSEFCQTPSLPDSEDSQEFGVVERPYCERHFHVSDSQGWADQYSICPLPVVYISLKQLSTAVHMLLDTHQGSLPLISFCDCYEAEIGRLPVLRSNVENFALKEEEGESNPSSSGSCVTKEPKGVPLEHLIACVTGVEVAKSVLCIKKVQWLENRVSETQISLNFSPALAGQLTLFGREVMDLLKNQPQCLVAFNKFIPTYHHHFGRQCRVADYGFTKLIDLLEAIPHIVQVLGEGQNRQVTLTHRTQVKRFSAELLRILKSRASKQIEASEFSQAYEQVIEKPFEITNYGVCELEDMLDEVPENSIVTCRSGTETIISIPRREQTPEEIERTKQFAEEVIELMKHTSHCTMAFNKFIPAYHHHFGKQCRVADYGFTKLIELFEALPSVLEMVLKENLFQVLGTGEDKVLKLITFEQHKILAERLISILKRQPNEIIDLNHLGSAYVQAYGHALRPTDFGFRDLLELLEKMNSSLKVFTVYGKSYVSLADHGVVHQISLNIRQLLMEHRLGKMHVEDLSQQYKARYGQNVNIILHLQDMADYVKVENDVLKMTPLLKLVQNIILLLQENGGQVSYSNFINLYDEMFGETPSTVDHGFTSVFSLLENVSDYFVVKGKKQKRIVCLNEDNIVSQLPLFASNATIPNVDGSSSGYNNLYNTNGAKALDFPLVPKKLPCNVFPHQVIQQRFPSSENSLHSAVYFNPQYQLPQRTNPFGNYAQNHFVMRDFHASSQIHNEPQFGGGSDSTKGNVAHLQFPQISDIKRETESCEDLTQCEKFHVIREIDYTSSRSTPIRTSRLNRRSRIAAQFSMPLN